jgi:DNA-binding MarR family transcriptional regulator
MIMDRHISDAPSEFDLEQFLPFILNQTAEITSKAFQSAYRDRFGLSRTQWRVLAIAGRYENLTSRAICDIAHEEKSRVSRAVSGLVEQGFITREVSNEDKRAEFLYLTEKGRQTREQVGQVALEFDRQLRDMLGVRNDQTLRDLLQRIGQFEFH